jgi:hypothetical protein
MAQRFQLKQLPARATALVLVTLLFSIANLTAVYRGSP